MYQVSVFSTSCEIGIKLFKRKNLNDNNVTSKWCIKVLQIIKAEISWCWLSSLLLETNATIFEVNMTNYSQDIMKRQNQ